METGERLSAYLAGELGTDETSALEAELARDPALRARLDRLRTLEAALGDLPEVEVPAGFSASVRRVVQDQLDLTPLPGDELGQRRLAREQRRQAGMPRWVPALAGAAALVAVVAGGATLVSGMFGGAADEAAEETAAAGMAADEAAMEPEAQLAEADTAQGPVIVSMGAAYDASGLEALPGSDRFQGIVDERLTEGDASRYARDFGSAFAYDDQAGGESGGQAESTQGLDGAEEEAPAGETAPPEDATALARDSAEMQIVGEVSGADFDDIIRCSADILSVDDTLIPIYAELATFEGEAVIVYGLASLDPEAGRFTRIEIWVASRADCATLFFSQQDR